MACRRGASIAAWTRSPGFSWSGRASTRCRIASPCAWTSMTLALHQRGHGVQIHADTSLVGQLRGEFDREAESVMKIEHLVRDKSSALEQRLEALHSLP